MLEVVLTPIICFGGQFLEEGGVDEAGVVVDELEDEELEAVADLVLGLRPRLLHVRQERRHPAFFLMVDQVHMKVLGCTESTKKKKEKTSK